MVDGCWIFRFWPGGLFVSEIEDGNSGNYCSLTSLGPAWGWNFFLGVSFSSSMFACKIHFFCERIGSLGYTAGLPELVKSHLCSLLLRFFGLRTMESDST
jgi:hypothetical protein